MERLSFFLHNFPVSLPIFIDSDNALGSRFGDPDDGFAIAALLKSGLSIAALSSVRGNTSEEQADRNNRRLGKLCGYGGPYLRGSNRSGGLRDVPSDAASFLLNAHSVLRVAALGPLTNIAEAIEKSTNLNHIKEVIVVGANTSSIGKWPPIWPHEFNLTKDPRATRVVFNSSIPLVFIPLNILSTMRVSRRELAELHGEAGTFIQRHSGRWFHRVLFVKWQTWFRVCDLVAAMFLIDPEGARMEQTVARLHGNTRVEFGSGSRSVSVMRGFDQERWWRRFVELVNQ